MTCDKVICKLNTHLYADSVSQLSFLEVMNINGGKKIECLGKGGFAGIDLTRFSKEKLLQDTHPEWFVKVKNKFLIGFVGRIVKEKGIEELLESFKKLQDSGLEIALILIGPFEPELDPIDSNWISFIKENQNIIHTGFMEKPERALVYCDLLCLPSYREGFPMVVLEAGCLEIPAVVSRIPGNIDTVIENETGLLFDLNSKTQLTEKIEQLYFNRDYLKKLGQNSRNRVLKFFTESYLHKEFVNEYKRIHKKT